MSAISKGPLRCSLLVTLSPQFSAPLHADWLAVHLIERISTTKPRSHLKELIRMLYLSLSRRMTSLTQRHSLSSGGDFSSPLIVRPMVIAMECSPWRSRRLSTLRTFIVALQASTKETTLGLNTPYPATPHSWRGLRCWTTVNTCWEDGHSQKALAGKDLSWMTTSASPENQLYDQRRRPYRSLTFEWQRPPMQPMVFLALMTTLSLLF